MTQLDIIIVSLVVVGLVLVAMNTKPPAGGCGCRA